MSSALKKAKNLHQTKQISLIITVLNEQETILDLLQALARQTKPADEIIIVDGGSTDDTPKIITDFFQKNPELKIKLIIEPQLNISQGRNLAIKKAKYPLIAITDAGCIPHPDWLEELLKTYQNNSAPVVAGFYEGASRSNFEQAVVPYVLVMPDRVNPDTFLPATRSMLMEKRIWDQLGGFCEDLTVSEDFAFAHQLKKYHIKIAFSAKAEVAWIPRKNLSEFSQMIFRFARGDIQAGIFRPKITLIFLRYWLGLITLIWLWPRWLLILLFFTLGLSAYSYWSIKKNKKYVPQGWYWLPILQITADLAVMWGTTMGLVDQLKKKLFVRQA